ncbi:hypothetical protein [Streptomyces sp. NPDC051211]|uniref:hypothetical protein n=1 Tax=Streptomyces sp. NPDC051211 TaxID=3154643 RepID=UPI00345009B0
MASPLPLGFLALAGGAVALAGLQLGWISGPGRHAVPLILLAFAFPLALVSSLVSFRCRDTAAATALGTVAGIWLTGGAVLGGVPHGLRSEALGLFLVFAAAALLVPLAAVGAGKLAASAAFGVAALHFLLTGVYELAGGSGLRHAAGVVGIAVTVLALYAAAAFALEDARGHAVLPLGRHGRSARAVEDGTEPGIRPEL